MRISGVSNSLTRTAVELMLAEFMLGSDVSMKAWAKKVGVELRECRVRRETYHLKLMDAIAGDGADVAQGAFPLGDQEVEFRRLARREAYAHLNAGLRLEPPPERGRYKAVISSDIDHGRCGGRARPHDRRGAQAQPCDFAQHAAARDTERA